MTMVMKLFKLSSILFACFCAGHIAYASNANLIRHSITSGRDYLLTKITHDAAYLDCVTVGPIPCPVQKWGNIFSIYFIAQALSGHFVSDVKTKMVIRLMHERRKPQWLWGYTDFVPKDSDDTSFALQLLLMLKQEIKMKDLQLFYQPKMNGYSTLLTNNDAQPEIDASEKNNFGIHPEVNANIFYLFQLLHLENKINYELLLKFQSPEGYWFGYFYPSKYYSTFLNMKVLCHTHRYQKHVDRGTHFIISSQHKEGSWGTPGNPYETALALNTLLTCSPKEKKSIKRGVSYLLLKQDKEGFWSSKEPIWFFIYKDNPMSIWSAYDSEHVVTTALALEALRKYLREM